MQVPMMTMVNKIAELIRQKKEEGHFVFLCGNGGSAANAEHFTNDLFSRGVKALCLNSNTSIVTMIANDFGYSYVFEKQLQTFCHPNDLLILFTASGKSENLLYAVGYCVTVVITGKAGFAKDVDYILKVDSVEPGIIESKHLQIAHIITDLI